MMKQPMQLFNKIPFLRRPEIIIDANVIAGALREYKSNIIGICERKSYGVLEFLPGSIEYYDPERGNPNDKRPFSKVIDEAYRMFLGKGTPSSDSEKYYNPHMKDLRLGLPFSSILYYQFWTRKEIEKVLDDLVVQRVITPPALK
jgi:hypothetical protein